MPHARVLVVLTRAQRRGAEIEGRELADRLRASGYTVDIVALAPGGDADGPDVLGSRPIGVTTLRRLRRRASVADVVLAYGSATLPACALALAGTGRRFVYRSIGSPADWVRGTIHRWRTGLLFRRATRIAVLWSAAADSVHDLYGVERARVVTIPNARERSAFVPPTDDERAAAKHALGCSGDRPLAVTLGSLAPEKQLEHAVRAMAHLPHVDLVVAGDGPERAAIEELAETAPHGNVRLVGHVSDPRTILDAADVVVMTSRTEGMPGVIIEAGLCGVPTVAPPVGAIASMVADGDTGYLVPPDDAERLAGAIADAIEHRRRLGDGARERMLATHTWEVVLPKWLALLDVCSR